MSKNLIIYCTISEFHTFLKCNLFLRELKKRYKNEDINVICAIPEKAVGIINEADGLLLASNEYMDKQSANLPKVLDVLSPNGRESASARWSDTVKFIQKKYKIDDILLQYEEHYILGAHGEALSFPWHKGTDSLMESYRRDLRYLCSYLKEGNFLKPEFETYQRIKKKYGSIFNDKTYIIITRNFVYKQPETNTTSIIPELYEIIPHLLDSGIRIINIGFPPQKLHNSHENYIELCDNLSQDELMSLFYLSNGIILSGENGGFLVHASTMNDVFVISKEWSLTNPDLDKFSLQNARNESNTSAMKTYNLIEKIKNKEYNEILDIFLNHKKTLKQEFSPSIEKYYIDQKEEISEE